METRGGDTPDSRIIDAAAAAIGEGGIVIIPTDTLYAFACDALDRRAIERLCRIKGLNPAKNTLSILCADLSQASAFVRIDNSAYRLRLRSRRHSRSAAALESAFPPALLPRLWLRRWSIRCW